MKLLLTLKRYGNDGPWSTFNLQIGDHNEPQQVRVLPAFHHGHIVVVARDGCPDGQLPRNCSAHRGSVFDWKTTDWWDGSTKMAVNKTSPFPPEGGFGRLNTTVSIPGESPLKLRSQNVLLTQSMDPFVGVLGLAEDDGTLLSGQSTSLKTAMQSSSSPKRAMTFSYTAGCTSGKTILNNVNSAVGSYRFCSFCHTSLFQQEALSCRSISIKSWLAQRPENARILSTALP